MPQMSPMLWLNLYLMFTATLMVFIGMLYYTKTPTLAPGFKMTHSLHKLKWEW